MDKDSSTTTTTPGTDEDWRAKLTPEQFHVLREQGTERAFSGRYWNAHDDGSYHCAACGATLFDSSAKFELGVGVAELHRARDGSGGGVA